MVCPNLTRTNIIGRVQNDSIVIFSEILDILLICKLLRRKAMTPEVRNFEVEQILSDHPIHQRHEFSFTVDDNEFKGHFLKLL